MKIKLRHAVAHALYCACTNQKKDVTYNEKKKQNT